MSQKVWAEVEMGGSGYDLQASALSRLGPEVSAEFSLLTTADQIMEFAEKYKDQLSDDEYQEFSGYAGFIGMTLGN